VFGVHGVGGIVGALLTGVFAAPQLGGQGIWDYVTNKDVGRSVFDRPPGLGAGPGDRRDHRLVGRGAFVAFKLVDIVIGLRVPEEQEREGLDITSHGESAYHS
jgi:Amt family ammonium transporter